MPMALRAVHQIVRTINAAGRGESVNSFSSTVTYPLSVEVAGTYYNEITGAPEPPLYLLRPA